MRIRTLFMSIIGAAMLLMSCEKEETKTLYHSYGVAYPVDGEEYSFKVKTDLGNTLIPSTTNYKIEGITRVYATFTLVNDDDSGSDSLAVNFKFMDDILYKGITDRDTSLGNDPIYVRKNEIWQSKYNEILNVKFAFDGGQEMHLVNLYLDTLLDHSDTVYLSFRHNANADPLSNRYDGLVSFDLSSLDSYLGGKDSIPYQVSFNRGSTNVFLEEWNGMYKPE